MATLSKHAANTTTNDPTATTEQEKLFDEYYDGPKLLTRRPDADSSATKRVLHEAYILPDRAIASLTVSAKSVEQSHNITKAGITGRIKSMKKRALLTSSASTEIYGQKLVTDAYLRLGEKPKTQMKDANVIAFENSCNINTDDLRVRSAGMGYDAANFDFTPYVLNTTNINLVDVTGPFTGKNIIPSLIDDEIVFCCKYNTLTEMANQTSNQTIAISEDVLIVEWEELTPEEYDSYRKVYQDPNGAFEFTFLENYMPAALAVSGTTKLSTTDLKLNHKVPFAWAVLKDADVTLNNSSLDFMGWSSYRLGDINRNSLFKSDATAVTYKNEHDERMASIFDSTFLFRKNIISLNAGAGNNILTILKQQSWAPSTKFFGTECFEITSTEAGCDTLQLYVYYFAKIGLYTDRSAAGAPKVKFGSIVEL